MENTFRRYPVSVRIPVAWGDMDAFQHVNNTVFLRWVETARIRYFESLRLADRVRAEGVGPILARTTIDYRKPVTYPDTVDVDVTVTTIGNSSFVMAYRVRSRQLGTEVAHAETVIVVFDYGSGRSVPIDDELRGRIAALESGAASPPDLGG